MKIEKVNENQIRCTLSREELEDRQIKISELAYGSEKAKGLFRDMIQQANYEFGFEADDIPLMVEAIPLSKDAIVLQITKVEYPEELDTRFAKFSEAEEEESVEAPVLPKIQGADDILELFGKSQQDSKETISAEQKEPPKDLVRMFEFTTIENLERLSHILGDYYSGENQVYKDIRKNRYFLCVHKNDHTPEEFNKICNIISEYGFQKKYTPAAEGYLKEHGKIILKNQALQILNSL